MPDYRRARATGATYFFTVNLADRRSRLLVDRIELLRLAVRETRQLIPFSIEAMVVLPDHLHCLWTLPPGDANFSLRWQRIKTCFSRGITSAHPTSASQLAKGERGIWQRRFWEHLVRDDTDYAAHIDYIHYNPVKHGHVGRAADWPYSSFHRYARAGLYSLDWGGLKPQATQDDGFGERSRDS